MEPNDVPHRLAGPVRLWLCGLSDCELAALDLDFRLGRFPRSRASYYAKLRGFGLGLTAEDDLEPVLPLEDFAKMVRASFVLRSRERSRSHQDLL